MNQILGKVVRAVCALLCVCQCAFGAASLSFETHERKVTMPTDAKKLDVYFPFQNNSSEEVIVLRYEAPCTCMSAMMKGGTRLSKGGPVRFAPGEKGVIKGVFELGNFKGTVEKKIVLWVKGDAADKPSITLTTQVTIPSIITAEPQSLIWNIGEERKAKEIRVTVSQEKPIRILKTSCSSPEVEYTLETIKEGFEYKLTVLPKSTQKITFAALRLTTDSKNPRFKAVQTFVTVKPAKK